MNSRPFHARPLPATVALTLTCALTLAAAPTRADPLDLPELGSSAGALMTPAAEARLGQAFMRQVRKAAKVSDDALTTDYVETLGRELLAADKDAAGSFTFFAIDEPVVNAFAGPGGYIGVYAGLVLATESEDELAAVMAHEIAHVTQRHLMRSIEDQGKFSVPATALMIAAAILGAQVSGDAGAAAIAAIQGAVLQRQINFTRDNEKEADRIGITTLASSGRDPYAMAGFFDRLSRVSRIYEDNTKSLPEFLRTHPVNSRRIADALGRADELGARRRPDSLRYQLTRARLRERSFDRPEKALAAFQATLGSGRYASATAERYGYALALLRSNRYAEAKTESTRLLAVAPSLPELVLLDADIDMRQGKTAQAVSHLKQAVELSPANWVLRTAYGSALMQAGESSRALEELKQAERLRPGNVSIYELLTQAAIKSGNKGATYRYRAEKLYAEGDLEPAIRQLEFALRQRDLSYYDAAQIQVRLENMREEQKDEKKRKERSLGAVARP